MKIHQFSISSAIQMNEKKEEKQPINNIAEQQIKNQVKQMKTESFKQPVQRVFKWITKKKHIQSC